MREPQPLAPETTRLRSPDGFQKKFNCCQSPTIWEYDDNRSRCRTCGHDWTDVLEQSDK